LSTQTEIRLRKFSVPHRNLELVEYFKQAAKLRYGSTKKEALKLPFPYGKQNGVVMPDCWVNSEYTGNIWLRGLRKHHESSV
jgi:hypothetical protein